MKTNASKLSLAEASVLLVTMCILGVAAIAVGSYLLMVQNQTSSVARSQTWNNIVPIAEAGIEEALAMVNLGAPNIITSPTAWTNSAVGSGWSAFSAGKTSLTRYVSGSNYYTVTIDISGVSNVPVITSVGVIPYSSVPWIFSSGQQPLLGMIGFRPFLAQVSQSSSTGTIGRKIRVQTVLNPLFNAAVITKLNFDMKGNNTRVDSFDSSNPLYSTAGQYDPLKFECGGSVATDSAIVGDVNVGNGNIYGNVYTGPGTSQSAVQVGNNGTVGGLTSGGVPWAGPGIQPGAWSGDFNVNIPDVNPPPTGSPTLPAPTGNPLTVNLPSGNYTISPNDPNIGYPLNITGNSTLWVQGSYTPAGLTIATTNSASLKLYIGTTSGSGDSTTLGGNQALNWPGYADNLQVYGLPSLNSISMHGNAAFVGTIYAPEADVTCGGGGNNTSDSSGAIICKSLTLNGHWNFHYDQNLAVNGPSRGWIPKNWTELKYP